MRRIGVIATTFVLAGALGSGGAMGAKVNLPKEGKYAFDFCPIGHGRTFSGGEKFFVMSYDLDAVIRATPANGPFDRMGARCYGLYKSIAGKPHEAGVCELTDLDGDKWWMDYEGTWDGRWRHVQGGLGQRQVRRHDTTGRVSYRQRMG